jgi:hypothetical protein
MTMNSGRAILHRQAADYHIEAADHHLDAATYHDHGEHDCAKESSETALLCSESAFKKSVSANRHSKKTVTV